ncbi:MAG TPA: peptidylprolyl isomerase [Fimbriimonadaceae bacterium]|nr:peptidylprolyl isomerase [Fimbriimonadaceae bacterium]
MSINQINKLFQNKGCNIAVSTVLGVSVIMMLGAGMRGCGGQDPNQQQAGHMQPVVTVGDFKISPDLVKSQQNESPVATERMRQEGSQIDALIHSGLALILAKKEGVDLSDANVKQSIIQQELGTQRQYLEMIGQLRPGATEQEFESAFKSMNGVSLLDARKQLEAKIDGNLKDDTERLATEGAAAPALLIDKYKSKFTPTEDEVKKQFDMFRVKSITVTPKIAGVKPDDPKAKDAEQAKAEAILKEIKGGLSFEAAMDKYLDKPTEKGKKASDESNPIPADSITGQPYADFLSKAKPGDVSEIFAASQGPTILKYVGRKIELPADYASKKAQLLDDEAKRKAGKYVSDEINKLDTPANVKWDSDGYHILHDFLAIDNAQPPAPDKSKKLKDIVDRALKIPAGAIGSDAAAAAARLALREVTSTMPAAEAAKLATQVLSLYVQQFPELDAKIELTEAYIKAGDADNTASTAKDAADMISVRTDDQGKALWAQLNKAITEAKDKKLFPPDVVKSLDASYVQWLKDYAAAEQEKKDEEAERKKTEEELNKAKAMPPTDNKAPTAPPAGKPTDNSGKKDASGKKENSVLHPETNKTGK